MGGRHERYQRSLFISTNMMRAASQAHTRDPPVSAGFVRLLRTRGMWNLKSVTSVLNVAASRVTTFSVRMSNIWLFRVSGDMCRIEDWPTVPFLEINDYEDIRAQRS
jgi:hypothetical protein